MTQASDAVHLSVSPESEDEDSGRINVAWQRARSEEERGAIMVSTLREVLAQSVRTSREVQRLASLVSHSAQASADFARANQAAHVQMSADIKTLAAGQGHLAESLGVMAKDVADLHRAHKAEAEAREKQDSLHEEEITATRQAVKQTAELAEQAANDARAAKAKALALHALRAGGVVGAYEGIKLVLEFLSDSEVIHVT